MKNIIFYTAPYCAACKLLQPKIEAIAAETGTQIVKIDITTPQGKASANNAGITVLPVVMLIDNNVQLYRKDGGITEIEKDLDRILGSGETGVSIINPKQAVIIAAIGLAILINHRQRKKRKKKEI